MRKGRLAGDQPEVYAYDHIDLPEIKPVVTRVNIHSGACRHCGKRIAGTPPAGMLPGSPFGPGIAALAIYLHTRHMVSYNRLWRCSKGCSGLKSAKAPSPTYSAARTRRSPRKRGASMPRSVRRRDRLGRDIGARRRARPAGSGCLARPRRWRTASRRAAAKRWSASFLRARRRKSGSATASARR